jgi:hypothetical protein
LVRTGSAVDEKNGAKTTIPLTRTRTRVIEARKVGQSSCAACGMVFGF